jgi:mannosyltransferase
MRPHLRALAAQLQKSRTAEVVVLLAIIVLATVLRLYKLGTWSYWIDEIFTINRALRHVNLRTLLAEWWHPSLSLIATAGSLHFFGVSEWSARLVAALVGIVTIPVLYVPIKRLFGPAVALIASLLLAVSPWHVEWSQNARFYTGLLLLYFLSAYSFFLALERDRPRYLLLSGILLVLAIGERFLAVFLVPVVLTYVLSLALLPIEKPTGLRARNVVLILVPAIVFGLGEIIRLITTGNTYLMGAVDLIYSAPIDDPFRLASFIAFDIGLPVITLALCSGIYLLRQKSRASLFVLLNALVPVGLLLLVNPFYFTQDRYVFMVLPFWLILAGFAVRKLLTQANDSGRIFAIGVLILLLADAAGDNLLYYHVNNGNRHDWKRAFALVREQSQPDDQYVSWYTQFGPYYLNREIIPWADLDPNDVRDAGKRFWFILDEDTVWGNETMKPWIERNARLIDVLYLRRQRDNHLRIYLYDPNR